MSYTTSLIAMCISVMVSWTLISYYILRPFAPSIYKNFPVVIMLAVMYGFVFRIVWDSIFK